MQIRKALLSDAPNLVALGICVWVDTYAYNGVSDKISRYVLSELVPEKLAGIINTRPVYVSHNGADLTGYMVLGPERDGRVEIETLYVLPRFHGMGIGRQLVDCAKSCANKLWLSAWDGNAKAIAFYRKLGFTETGEQYFDLYGDKIRNVVMEYKGKFHPTLTKVVVHLLD